MDTALAKRRYRFGRRLFTGSVRRLRRPLLAWIVLTPILSLVFSSAIETGLWTITATVFLWFVAATAGIWISTTLPTSLARGLTRHELTVAAVAVSAVLIATLTLTLRAIPIPAKRA